LALYIWTGYTDKGKENRGMVDATSLREAKLKLRSQGVYVSTIAEEVAAGAMPKAGTLNVKDLFGRVKKEHVVVITRQLATLVGASIPLVEALSALYEQMDVPILKKTMAQVRDAVNEGASFADALSQHKKIFPDLYINMVRSGEASGALDIVLLRLAEFLEGQQRLRAKVGAAMIYPAFLICVAFVVVTFLMVSVVPKMVNMFESMHQKLPLVTRILIVTSGFLGKTWWIILIAVAAVIYLIMRWQKTEHGALRFDRFRMRMPLYGQIYIKLAVARFARTLGTLLASGVPIIEAMRIVQTVVQNKVMEVTLQAAISDVIEGSSLGATLRKSGVFPPIVIHMIEVGERSGTLEDMLMKAADAYEEDVATAVAGLTSIIEPIMIIIMGVTVGFIILAILFPMLEMSQIIR
jgi:general secretion pathway protein F